MSGFTNDVMNAENVNFTGSNPTVGGVTADGQLLIGASTFPYIRPNTLTAGTGITITNGPGSVTVASTASLTDLHTARFIVASSTNGTGANFTSIQSAINAAQGTGVNSTVFLQPGTYTENLTLVAGVNLAAYTCDALTPNVTIVGKLTHNTAGTVSISGIRLQTNSDFALVVGPANLASIVNLDNCYLNCTTTTGISFTSASASSAINITNCKGDLGTTGIAVYSMSSAGTLNIRNLFFTNSGGSSTANTQSAGLVALARSQIVNPITTSSTAAVTLTYNTLDSSTQNATPLTLGGSGSQVIRFSTISGGTASAASISTTATIDLCEIISSNANAITGAGTLNYSNLTFSGSSSTINTSTLVPQQIGPKLYATGGISFDSGSNLLANYVTTTSWTPVLNFGGATTGITYSTQVGRYVRIGSLVFYQLNLILSSKGTATGAATITGLPFTILNTSGTSCFTTAGYWVSISFTANYHTVNIQPSVGTTTLTLLQAGDNTGLAFLADTNVANTSQIQASGFYFT